MGRTRPYICQLITNRPQKRMEKIPPGMRREDQRNISTDSCNSHVRYIQQQAANTISVKTIRWKTKLFPSIARDQENNGTQRM